MAFARPDRGNCNTSDAALARTPVRTHGCPVKYRVEDWCFFHVMAGLGPRLCGSHGSEYLCDIRVPSRFVMAAHVAAVHVFGAASKDVDGGEEPGHDVEKAPVDDTIFNRTAVPRGRP
jgi:hypothetical protein